jgi:hypothetical protein
MGHHDAGVTGRDTDREDAKQDIPRKKTTHQRQANYQGVIDQLKGG